MKSDSNTINNENDDVETDCYNNVSTFGKMIAFFNVFMKTPIKYLLIISILITALVFVEIAMKYWNFILKYGSKCGRMFKKAVKKKDLGKQLLFIVMGILYFLFAFFNFIFLLLFLLFIILLCIPINYIVML